jgi:flagellar basal-body rod modification protein FlgD
MTTITQTSSPAVSNAATSASTNSALSSSGLGSLGEQDFLTMLTTELKQQDPTDPVDQKDMLGQMAQFSSLAAQNTGNSTLGDISSKLDTLIAVTAGAQSTDGSQTGASQTAGA